ncbi:hypothetical protein [uncultured Parasphingorhabdus sp.]|uniref:hypothetical protein n=1 Tax=uncultured Parasphingorhabdus sp. TaxID=2709694 RepID=UPI0037487CEB
MSSGGDARITMDPATGLNRYHSSPWPRDIIAYASSTANDISKAAFAHVQSVLAKHGQRISDPEFYQERLEHLRHTIRTAYDLPQTVQVAFAPSGTDLEYIALLSVKGDHKRPVHNILLGSDEVGSGCIHSAHGHYFSGETALSIETVPGMPVDGLGDTSLQEFPVRDEAGVAYNSIEITGQIEPAIRAALERSERPLVHIVHGSKTGLILPHLAEIDALRDKYGSDIAFVVDACQARITSAAIADYLQRDIMVFLTGSKFMGGPPFSGFALMREDMLHSCGPIPAGLCNIFRRAEFPRAWPGQERLRADSNPGLLLRLEASLFELERFQALPTAEIRRITDQFREATQWLCGQIGAEKVHSYPPGEKEEARLHPLEMRTLVTINISDGTSLDFDDATRIHKAMVARDIRLGQPVRCVKWGNGRFGGTLRLGLSMPQMINLAALDDAGLAAKLRKDMATIAGAYQEARDTALIAADS